MYLPTLSISTLCQLKTFLATLTDEAYTETIQELSNATIGQHTRHIIEFYSCLTEQIKLDNTINYDKRLRKTKLETSKEATIIEIDKICKSINDIKDNRNLSTTGHLGDVDYKIPTSVKRELLYVLEHAVHHMAIIKIAVKILKLNISIPPNFGIAESTLVYRKCAQ